MARHAVAFELPRVCRRTRKRWYELFGVVILALAVEGFRVAVQSEPRLFLTWLPVTEWQPLVATRFASNIRVCLEHP